MDQLKLNPLSTVLVKAFQNGNGQHPSKGGIRVNPIVSEIASWYEKVRNAMEYREDEVILRATIERILKRRLIFGGNGKTVSGPLVRELVWARYFPDGTISDETVQEIQLIIDLYLELRDNLIRSKEFPEHEIDTWVYHLLSSHLEKILSPHNDKETMINFMFHILRKNITIIDDTESTRDAQVFIAIRRAYAKNDIAFLRYHLFNQYFGDLNKKNIEVISKNFKTGMTEIEKQLNYPLRFKIFAHVKKQTPPFLILDDVLSLHKEELPEFLRESEKLSNVVFEICQKRYESISAKIRRALIRSVIFILLSKTLFAFLVEGSYERYFFGEILWGTMALNVFIPPVLMIIVGLSIRTPGRKNSEKILERITFLLFDKDPIVGNRIKLRVIPKKGMSVLETIFRVLWFAAFIASFGFVIFVLTRLHFNPVSQTVFIFFLAIVSFLAYRINRTAQIYTVESRQGLITPVINFFFIPIAQVGRYLTEGIAQINILLFIFDFVIETPFKGIFGFFDQWFYYLHTKRDYLE